MIFEKWREGFRTIQLDLVEVVEELDVAGQELGFESRAGEQLLYVLKLDAFEKGSSPSLTLKIIY